MQITRKEAAFPQAHGLGLAALLLGLAAAPAAQAQTYTLTTLTSFNGTNGAEPGTHLTLIGSTLYGTTTEGGGFSNNGTVFSVPVAGGAPTTLAGFNLTDGANPDSGLTLSADGSTFYGTTQTGGSYNAGTVFSVPVGGGTPTTLAVFNGSNGFQPLGALTLLGSTLYGTTDDGGANRAGAVFSVPVTGGTPTDLASFDTTTGNTPEAGLTLSADGKTFYGTTYNGGLINGGTVFSVPVAGGALTTLASFNGTDGLFPAAGLTLSADGKTLYGTTQGGGNGSGTVFSVPVTGGTPTSLVIFNGTNGSIPSADLTLLGGALYGTTAEGGVNNDGTAFSVPVGGGSPTTLVSFSGTNGIFPDSSLMFSGSTLYGTTAQGGAFGDGTVFSLTPNAAPIPEASSLVSFGLLLLGGLSAAALRARRKSGAV